MRVNHLGIATSVTSRSDLNRRMISALEDSDWESMKEIYLELAELHREDQADPLEVVRQARRCELKALRSQGITDVRMVVNEDDCCDACHGLNGQVLPLAKALAFKPLPSIKCTFDRREGVVDPGWCRCSYVAA